VPKDDWYGAIAGHSSPAMVRCRSRIMRHRCLVCIIWRWLVLAAGSSIGW